MAATAREGDETRAARCLMELIAGKKLAPADARWLRSTNVSFGWTTRGGSWNIPQIRMAALLWLDGQDDSDWWWVSYLRRQLGDIISEGDRAPDDPIYFFGGTESGSNTYEGWRWSAVLAVRLWALQHSECVASKDLLRLTTCYSEVQTALLALGAAPGPTRTGDIISPVPAGDVPIHANRRGQLWWRGPSLPMSGNRSTPAHIGTDERMPLYLYHARYIADVKLDRFGWPNEVLTRLAVAGGSEPAPVQARDEPVAVLAGIRLRTPHHFARWQNEGIRANWIAELGNKNTSSLLGHATYEREERAVYLFPFEGRQRKGVGEATCDLVPWTSGADVGQARALVARSRFGQVSVELPARNPDSHVVVDASGVRVIQ